MRVRKLGDQSWKINSVSTMVLTNRSPFVGPTAQATQRLAAAADLGKAFSKLDACGADAELVTLCKRCLSAEPAERPATAVDPTGHRLRRRNEIIELLVQRIVRD